MAEIALLLLQAAVSLLPMLAAAWSEAAQKRRNATNALVDRDRRVLHDGLTGGRMP